MSTFLFLFKKAAFSSIKELHEGQGSPNFQIHGRHAIYEDRAFSIIYLSVGRLKSLDLGKDYFVNFLHSIQCCVHTLN